MTDAKKRQEIWYLESANITRTAEALMEFAAKDANRSSDLFVTARHLEHIRLGPNIYSLMNIIIHVLTFLLIRSPPKWTKMKIEPS